MMSSYVRKCWKAHQERKTANSTSRKIDRQLKIQKLWESATSHKNILLFGSTRDSTNLFVERMLVEQKLLMVAMPMLRLCFASQHVKLCGELLLRNKRAARCTFSEQHMIDFGIFWSDEGVQECFTRLAEFNHGLETMRYFMDNLELVTSGRYSPTEEDLQCFHVNLSGVKQYSVLVNRVAFKITASVGLLSKRVINRLLAEAATCLLVVEPDRYHEVLSDFGEKTDNQLKRSLEILKDLLNHAQQQASIIVFFMNCDTFVSKLSSHDLREYFPAYQGAQQDGDAAKSFIANLFQSCQPSRDRTVYLYHHFIDQETSITDLLLKATRDITQRQHLVRYRLL